MTVTSGNVELEIDGTNLPISPVAVAEIAAGSYSGPPIGISAVNLFDNGSEITSLTLGASALTFTADDYRLVLNGTFPTSLSASLIDSLVGGGNADGLNISVSSAQLSRVSTGQVLLNVPNVANLDFTGLDLNDIPGSLVSLAAASAGDSVSVNTGTMLTPLDATLNGSTIQIAGVGPEAVLGFVGDAGITATNPSIDAESTISNLISGQSAAGTTLLDAVGAFVNQGSILADGPGGSSFTIDVEQNATIPGVFSNYGTILVGAGNQMTIATGAGTELLNAGTLITSDGTLEVTGGITGTGMLEIMGNAVLRLDGSVAAGTPIVFSADGAGSLAIADPTSMGGAITGFGDGDALSLAGIVVTGSNYANGVLTLNDAAGDIALDLPGSFTTSQFVVTNGSDGAAITVNTVGLLGALTVNQQIELVYIAYFDRAADDAGYTYWDGQNVSAENGGESASTAVTNLANAFAPQPETVALYPFLGQSDVDLGTPTGQTDLNNFVDAVYGNLFDRAADPAGAAYWVGQLTSGAIGLGGAALAIANGATGADAIEVQNKIAVAMDFTSRTAASPLSSSLLAAAKDVLTGVDGTSLNDASVAAGENATTAFVNGSTTDGVIVETTVAAPDTSVITVTEQNQLVDPGVGNHTIRFLGGSGADALVLHAGGVDQVSGFDPGTDVLDFSSLLGAAGINLNGDVMSLGNYVTVTDQGGDALVSFDPTGHGGGSTIAVLQGAGGIITSLDTLATKGAIRIT
jgi:hypothetical protein